MPAIHAFFDHRAKLGGTVCQADHIVLTPSLQQFLCYATVETEARRLLTELDGRYRNHQAATGETDRPGRSRGGIPPGGNTSRCGDGRVGTEGDRGPVGRGDECRLTSPSTLPMGFLVTNNLILEIMASFDRSSVLLVGHPSRKRMKNSERKSVPLSC